MIRCGLVAVAALFCALPAYADPAAPGPVEPSTCLAPSAPPFTPFVSHSRDELVAARKPIETFAADADVFAVCLNSALAILEDGWRTAHHPPDSVVEQAVAATIDDWQQYKSVLVLGYNSEVAPYSVAPASGGAKPLAPLDITLSPPPSDARMPLPPGTLLDLPPAAVGRTHICTGFYSPESVKHHETGRVTIGFDVAVDGAILNAHIVTSSGFDRLDGGAMACVTGQWRDLPAIHGGVAAASPGHLAMIAFDLR